MAVNDKTEGEVPVRVKALEPFGVQVGHDYGYRGKVGRERYRVENLGSVARVFLPLTPLEWCLTCMREPPPCPHEGMVYESFYIGPCCGITGAMQDIINSVFRDGGWADGHDLLELGELSRQHDAEDESTFYPMTDEVFDEWVQKWTANPNFLDPWMKMGVVLNAVEPLLKQASYMTPSETPPLDRRPEDQHVIHVLHGTLGNMSWSDMFTRNDPDDLATHKANRVVLQAKLYPMVVRLHELLDAEGVDFHGYGIVRTGTDELLHNMRGLCLYPTREMAERIVELWKRQETEESARAKHDQDDEPHEPVYVTPNAEIVHVIVDKTGVHIGRT